MFSMNECVADIIRLAELDWEEYGQVIELCTRIDVFEYNSIDDDELEYIFKVCKNIISSDELDAKKIYFYSMLMKLSNDKDVACSFLKWIESSALSFEIKYNLWVKISSYVFQNNIAGQELKLAGTSILFNIREMAKKKLDPAYFMPIPKDERNDDLIVIITTQFLNERHGPTKHALNHACALKALGKQVVLINTAEWGKGVIDIPFFSPYILNYVDELQDVTCIETKDNKIPFFQCDNNMPNVVSLGLLLDMIRKQKPLFVLEIGACSLLASLIEESIPVLSNGTLHAQIECSTTKFQTISRPLNEDDIEYLNKIGLDERNMIFSMFSVEIGTDYEHVGRMELGVPEDAFAVAIVGYRLDFEIDEKMVQILADAVHRNSRIYFIFFGGLHMYDKIFKGYMEFADHFINYGASSNIRGCLECCDLYFNPYRQGGGISAIEALVTGIPAVSVGYGDAGIMLGEDFWVDSVDDMSSQIVKYSEDKNYYLRQRNRARERGEYLQDTVRLLSETVEEFCRRAL